MGRWSEATIAILALLRRFLSPNLFMALVPLQEADWDILESMTFLFGSDSPLAITGRVCFTTWQMLVL